MRDYPDFALGAVPRFGGRDDRVLVDGRIAGRDSVVVEAGSHERSVRLKATDLVGLSRAQVADICREGQAAGYAFAFARERFLCSMWAEPAAGARMLMWLSSQRTW